MPSSCVCVCVSVTLQYCIKTAKRRITQSTPQDSPMTLVFWRQRSWRNSNGIIRYGGDKCRWGGLKFVTFDEKHVITRQEALLLQRDCARHLSVEILQRQNISLENPIVWHYLRDSTFIRFDTIPECDRHTHRQTTTAYTALSIASRGKNRPYCTAHQL